MTRLEQLRVNALLTCEDLADLTGVPARTIRHLETGGVRRPRIATLRPLAEHFDVPASELVRPAFTPPAREAA